MFVVSPPEGWERRIGKQLVVILGGTLVLLILAGRYDSKTEIMYAFFPLLWWTLLRKINKTYVLMMAVSLAMFYVLFVAPLVMTLRSRGINNEEGNPQLLGSSAFSETTSEVINNISENRKQHLEQWSEKTLYRFADCVPVGVIAAFVRDEGLLRGAGLQYIVWGLIPRFIWPNKPHADRGLDFTVKLGAASSTESATTSTGMTPAGELYWNFGWSGVILGMGLLGMVFGKGWWGSAGHDPSVGILEMIAYAGAMLSFVLGTGSAAGTFLTASLGTGGVVSLISLVRRRPIQHRYTAISTFAKARWVN
jgi:hypothetical protein